MWSPVEKTALAEAEVEYEDIVSTQIDVAFEIVESPIAELVGAHAVIWTTTPWTIPVNQAIAYGADVEYVVVRPLLTYATDDELRFDGIRAAIHAALPWFLEIENLIVAKELAPSLASRLTSVLAGLDLDGVEVTFNLMYGENDPANCLVIKGSDLAGTMVRHPMHALGGFFAKPRPMLDGSSFVTTETGTGLVHMSPDHGEDDFDLCKANGIEPQFAVEGDGKYRADWGWLGGQGSVINPKFNAPDGPICSDLRDAGGLLAASADYKHSYPHSWRSKAKVIYRCTPQWFVPMDREQAPSASLRSAPPPEGELSANAQCPKSSASAGFPKRARTASTAWSKVAPIGCLAASAHGVCRSHCLWTAKPGHI
jgi:isoleucyl-tRNA synthetase